MYHIFFLLYFMQLFSADATMFFKKIKKKKLTLKTLKNHPKKLHTYGSWEFFFCAAPIAQNSRELQLRFINSFIQSFLLRSLYTDFQMPLKNNFVHII